MKLKIRKATTRDIRLICDLWQEFRGNHDCIVLDANPLLKEQVKLKKDAKKTFRKYVLEHLKNKDSQILLAFVDGKIVGYSLSFVKPNIPIFALEKTGHFGDLFVKKEFRGLKISSKFRDEAVKFFKKKKIKVLSIQVWPQNKHAYNIYKRWGFKDIHVEMRKKI